MAEEQKKMNTEVTEENNPKSRIPLWGAAAFFLIGGGGVAAAAYLSVSNQRVYIENSNIQAPSIPLAPVAGGILQNVYVSVGDSIPANTVVAEVGTQLIKSTIAGLVITSNTNIGSLISPGTPVVTIVDPTQLRVDGQLQEDKGLADVSVGERAIFTVDAFPGKTYSGVVSEVSPTSHASDVVFQVSDQRQEQIFDVKVAYDIAKYPELRNGMSAKIWVYKK